MPKDIRSFFTRQPGKEKSSEDNGSAPSKPATTDAKRVPLPKKDAKPKPDSIDLTDNAAQQVGKKSKFFSSPAKGSTPVAATKGAQPRPKGAQKSQTKKPAPRKRKQVVSDSDDSDDDFQAEEQDEEDDSDIELDLSSDGEDVQPKRQKTSRAAKQSAVTAAPKPAKPPASAKRAAPASADNVEPPAKKAATTPAKKAATTPKAQPASAARARKSAAAAGPSDPAAQAAIAAVAAAIEKLPPESEVQFSQMEDAGGGGWGSRGDDAPPNHGSKELPRGHPDCLYGKTLVITGVLDSLKRDEAADLVKRHGGRVTGSVSGKTDFLLAGMNSGASKIRAAKEKNTKIIDEDGLLSLIRAAPAPVDAAAPSRQPEPAVAAISAEPAKMGGRVLPSFMGGAKLPPAAAASAAAAAAPPSRSAPAAAAAANRGSGGGAGASGSSGAGAGDGQLWVEKHKPRSSQELVGNNTLVATLRQWLQTWDAIHLHGQKPPEPAKGAGTKQRDLSKKAVLLSGPPGIGKTSSALIMCRELGYLPVEVNASDTRSKADAGAKKGIAGKLANSIKELATNSAIGTGADGKRKRMVLVMDEVDGMSGGDRGGVADLIQTIHRSKVPIIAICNDKWNQKLKSLRNHTLELDYRKPTTQQIRKRLAGICEAEGLAVNEATLDALIEGGNGDIRLILGQLQMVRLRTRALTYDQVKADLGATKDFEMSPFEAARSLLSFESEKLSLGSRIDLVFQDMDLVPLLVQENYLNHRPAVARSEDQRLRAIAKAADAFSAGDVCNRRVRGGNWGLMPFAAVVGTVYPATYMRGSREVFGLYPGEPNFPRFTAWLGNNSTTGKQRRLLGELHTRMEASGNFAADRSSLRLSYLPVLRGTLIAPLAQREKEGIEEVVHTMHEYCLSREDIDFVTDVTKFKTKAGWGEDPMKGVPTQVKSAFTRAFNQSGQVARHSTMVEEFKRGKGRKGGAAGGAAVKLEEEGEGEEGEAAAEGSLGVEVKEEEEEEEEPEELLRRAAEHGLVVQAKQPAAKGKGRGAKAGGGAAAKSGGVKSATAASKPKATAAKGRAGAGAGRGKK